MTVSPYSELPGQTWPWSGASWLCQQLQPKQHPVGLMVPFFWGKGLQLLWDPYHPRACDTPPITLHQGLCKPCRMLIFVLGLQGEGATEGKEVRLILRRCPGHNLFLWAPRQGTAFSSCWSVATKLSSKAWSLTHSTWHSTIYPGPDTCQQPQTEPPWICSVELHS